MPEPYAYFDGQMLPAANVSVSLVDAGFVWGATVSEHLRTFRFKPFRVDQHLARLERSLQITGIKPRELLSDLAFIARDIVKHNSSLLQAGDDLGLIVLVSPGSAATFSRVETFGPRVTMHTYPLPFANWKESYRTGVHLRIAPQTTIPSTTLPTELKCRSRMHYYLADQWANQREEKSKALLLDEEGFVNETTTANIIAVVGQKLISPKRSKILPGVSLAMVEELAAKRGWVFEEHDLVPETLLTAEEVFLASTAYCMLPVTAIDGHTIGSGKPGPVFGEILGEWSKSVGLDIVQQATLIMP